MVGGVFEGTNDNPESGIYFPIYTITTNPPPTWSEVSVDLGDFRYLRYRGPNRSYANVAEIEFYRKGVKVTGVGYGTPGSFYNNGNTFEKALDGNVSTRFDGPRANGIYVGIDTASPLNDTIRYYPRPGCSYRMVGGVFEGTNDQSGIRNVRSHLFDYDQAATDMVRNQCRLGTFPLPTLSRTEWFCR